MILKKWGVALGALMLVAPLSASALGISILDVRSTGASNTLLENGDVVTFDLVVENASQELLYGLGIGAYGYDQGVLGNTDDNNLVFAGGENANFVFDTAFVALDGLQSTSGVFEDGTSFPISDPRRVQIFDGIAQNLSEINGGTDGTGADDLGVGNVPISSGGVHFQVSFAAQDLGTASPLNPVDVTLEFGTGQFGNVAVGLGGSILPFSNTSYTLTIVPEPGTALLMGLGLAGLAVNRRR